VGNDFMKMNITPNLERSQGENFRFWSPKKLFFLTASMKKSALVTALTYVRYGGGAGALPRRTGYAA
jgi:hypothetical protein